MLSAESAVIDQGADLEDSWIRRHRLGPKAFNDTILLQCGIHLLLQRHFSQDPRCVSE
jgi:hypothetical protein